jgi:hypothetical protein
VNQGAIPDESPRNLLEQLLLQDAKAGNCRAIQGGPDDILGDVSREILQQVELKFKRQYPKIAPKNL